MVVKEAKAKDPLPAVESLLQTAQQQWSKDVEGLGDSIATR